MSEVKMRFVFDEEKVEKENKEPQTAEKTKPAEKICELFK